MAKGSSSYHDFNTLMTQLDAGELSNVYLLQGEEYRMLDQILAKIEENVLEEGTRTFNHHLLYGKETDPSDIINLARRFPMMAEKQLVVYKEAQYCKKPADMIPYLKDPMPSTILVWFHPGKKIAKNTIVGKQFVASGTVFTADPIAERDVAKVINDHITSAGYDIEPKPLHLLVENSGHKFSVILKELEKVFSNVPKGEKIRIEHIEKYVGINKEYNVFALQNAIAKKQRTKAVEILQYMKDNIHAHPLAMTNGSLFSYFRKVATVQSMARSTDKEVMSAVGISFYHISEYREAARNYNGKRILKVIEALHDMDLKFKGIKENTGSHGELLEETVLKILSL